MGLIHIFKTLQKMVNGELKFLLAEKTLKKLWVMFF